MSYINGTQYVYLSQYINKFRERLHDEDLTKDELFNALSRIGINYATINGMTSKMYLDSDLSNALQNRSYAVGTEVERYRREQKDLVDRFNSVLKRPPVPKPKQPTESQILQRCREDEIWKHEVDAENIRNERRNISDERMKKLSDMYLASDGVFGTPYGDPYKDELDESIKHRRRW